ncbi:MAG TPA: hypothetical protein VMI10_09600 [Terriglobales bacterium]|nr:hypothetical protein [Terriglobales bacterium]
MAERGSERNWVEPIVERVVDKVFQTQLVQLRSEITRRVSDEIAGQPSSAFSSTSADLARAIIEIQLGSTQKEILRALLDVCARYAARVALFVVKGSNATGWQARGFASNESLKDYALDTNTAAVARALTERVSVKTADGEFDSKFVEQFGTASNVRLLPLILKDKVAALVYADGGVEDKAIDAGALDVLVLATGSWLEVNSLRKQSHKEPMASQAEAHEPPARTQAAPAAPAFSDPFAAHSPAFAMAAAASSHSATAVEPAIHHETHHASAHSAAVEVQSTVAEVAVAEPLAVGHAHTEVVPEVPSGPPMSSEDEEVHRKAKRFARLLVDEIKLYNKSKLEEGRAKKNLYDVLKDPIDKSRATYQKRYGSTVAASGNYFEDEMKRSLAEDDLSVMGSNFQV